MRALRLLGLVPGPLAITAVASPWIALGLGGLGFDCRRRASLPAVARDPTLAA